MSNDAAFWNTLPTPGKSRPADRLWSMRKNGKQVDAELRGHGEYGWGCRFLYDGELTYSRRWISRALAVAESDEKRRELQREGWKQASDNQSAN